MAPFLRPIPMQATHTDTQAKRRQPPLSCSARLRPDPPRPDPHFVTCWGEHSCYVPVFWTGPAIEAEGNLWCGVCMSVSDDSLWRGSGRVANLPLPRRRTGHQDGHTRARKWQSTSWSKPVLPHSLNSAGTMGIVGDSRTSAFGATRGTVRTSHKRRAEGSHRMRVRSGWILLDSARSSRVVGSGWRAGRGG